MPQPLLEDVDTLIGAALRARLVEARAAAIAATAGDPAGTARVREIEQAVVAAQRAAIASFAALLPEAAAPTQPVPPPAPRPVAPIRRVPAAPPTPPAPSGGLHPMVQAAIARSEAIHASRLAELKRSRGSDGGAPETRERLSPAAAAARSSRPVPKIAPPPFDPEDRLIPY